MADPTNLNAVLAGLSNSLELTMASTHNLTIALCNSGTSAQLTRGPAHPEAVPTQLTALRGSLRTHWSDDITGALRGMYKVMGDLLVIVQSQSDSTCAGDLGPTLAFATQECGTIEFLQDILKDIGELVLSFKMAIARSEEIARGFETINSQLVSSWFSQNDDTSSMSLTELSVPPGLSPETQSFVRTSLSSAYPKAGPSARLIISSIKDTQAHLSHLQQFCVSISSTLQFATRSPNCQLPEQMPMAPGQTLHALVESCRTGRQNVQVAIANIVRSVDALVVIRQASTATCSIPSVSTMTKTKLTDPGYTNVVNGSSLHGVTRAPEDLQNQHFPSNAVARASLALVSFGTSSAPQYSETDARMTTTHRRTAFASMHKADSTPQPLGDKVSTEVAEEKSGICFTGYDDDKIECTPASCWKGFCVNYILTTRKRSY